MEKNNEYGDEAVDPQFNGEDTFASQYNRNEYDSFLSEQKPISKLTSEANSNRNPIMRMVPCSNIPKENVLKSSMTPDEIEIYGF